MGESSGRIIIQSWRAAMTRALRTELVAQPPGALVELAI
jgi:hypothetical protein